MFSTRDNKSPLPIFTSERIGTQNNGVWNLICSFYRSKDRGRKSITSRRGEIIGEFFSHLGRSKAMHGIASRRFMVSRVL